MFLLVVADPDERQAETLAGHLAEHGVTTILCRDGAEALVVAGVEHPDAVLAAATLPVIGGAEVTRALAARTAIPVVVGVGDNDGLAAAEALSAGATACVAHPYRLRELLPILNAISGGGVVGQVQTPVECGGLRLDPASFEVRLHGELVRMPMRELRLLHLLMTNAGRVVTRQQIMNSVWGAAPGSNTVTVHIQRLRARLGDDQIDPQMILTVRGVGYKLVPPPAIPSLIVGGS